MTETTYLYYVNIIHSTLSYGLLTLHEALVGTIE